MPLHKKLKKNHLIKF